MNEERDQEEKQGLGELTEQLFEEHEGRWPQETRAPTYEQARDQVPSNIAYQGDVVNNLEQRSGVSFQAPTLDKRVQSTYAARPINGRDFIYSGAATMYADYFTGTMELQDQETAVIQYTVPQGFVAVLTGFKFNVLNPSIGANTPNDNFPQPAQTFEQPYQNAIAWGTTGPRVTIRLDDVAVPDLTEMTYLGFYASKYIPCYVVADAGQIIQIAIDPPLALQLPPNTGLGGAGQASYYSVSGSMRGNLLLKTGVPAQYEPGSAR